MKQWIKYYGLSLVIIVLMEVIPAFLIVFVAGDTFNIGSGMLFYTLRFVILFIILILQGFIIFQNKKHIEVRSKFLIAFTCLYAILFTLGYVLRLSLALENCADSPFIGDYTLFLLPLILQIVVFAILQRKKSLTTSESIHTQ